VCRRFGAELTILSNKKKIFRKPKEYMGLIEESDPGNELRPSES
jgi:hypothetical protein